MATFEEQLLGYLDGSLGEADHEAIAASIATMESPERALFDAHLRLEKLYAVVERPVSAPLTVQRELAAKLPVLAIKLPYLATSVDRRDRAAGWFPSLRSSWVNVLLLCALLLLAGGIWYGLYSHTMDSTSSNGNDISAPSNRAPSSTASNVAASASTKALAAHAANGSAAVSLHARDANSTMSAPTTVKTVNTTSAHRAIANNFAKNNSRSGSNDRIHQDAQRNALQQDASQRDVLQQSAMPQAASQNSLDQSSKTISNNPSSSLAPEDNSNLPPLRITAISIPNHAVSDHVQSERFTGYPITEPSEGFVPIRVFAFAEPEWTFFNPSSLSPYVRSHNIGVTSNSVAKYGFGVDAEYEFSPWISAGIRGGEMNAIQYQPTLYFPSNVYRNAYRDVQAASVASTWLAVSATETFNPQDRLRYSISLAGGPTLSVPGMTGMAIAGIEQDITNAFVARAEISYNISRIAAGTASVNTPTLYTEGFSTVAIPSSLTSSAIGFSLGISFHP